MGDGGEPRGKTSRARGERTDREPHRSLRIVVVGANADSSYRKGISSVVMERQNEYDAWLDFNATWMGPETGSGNQWTATITHLAGDTVRITATAASHSTKTITAAITASC